MDRYSKFVLTVIAAGLWALVIALVWRPVPARAAYGSADVNIASVGGMSVVGGLPVTNSSMGPLQVDLRAINGSRGSAFGWGLGAPPIPVEVKR